jgi:hypothetical protein
MTPYQVVYGKNLLSMASYILGTSKVNEIDITLHTKGHFPYPQGQLGYGAKLNEITSSST